MDDPGAQSALNLELSQWLANRQSLLKISKTTVTPSRKTLDWVPIESQSDRPIATPPPSDPLPVVTSDPNKPTKGVAFEVIEPGGSGLVPILRPDISRIGAGVTLQEFLSKQRRSSQPGVPNPAGYFHATTVQGVVAYGCDGWLNVWDPKINIPSSPGDDHSISQTWLENYQKPQMQTLEAGWTVDQNLNGDLSPHLFTFYTTNDYTNEGDNIGGYNRVVSGWVQTHPSIYPGILITGMSVPGGDQLEFGIKYKLHDGNWWFGVNNDESGPWIWIGYYPASLFNGGIGNQVDTVSFGGEVDSNLANPCSTFDQMGSGRHASAGWSFAAYQRNLRIQTDTGGTTGIYNGTPETDEAASNCPTNNYTIQAFMNSGSAFASYQYYGGPGANMAQAKAGSPLTCLLAGSAGSRVYYLDKTGNIHELAWKTNVWNVSGNLAAASPVSLLTSLYVSDVGSRIYYLDIANNVRELAYNGGWKVSNPIAAALLGSPLTCLTAGSAGGRVYYLDLTGSIRELAWNGSSWNNSGPLAQAAPGSPLTSFYISDVGSRIYYLDPQNNVRELAWNGSSWNTSDPLVGAASGSPLTCVLAGSAGSRVYYLDTNKNIHELAWNGSSWNNSGALAQTASGSPLTSLYISDVGSRIYYVGQENHIHELALGSGAGNTDTGAVADSTSPLTCLYEGDSGSRVYYLATDFDIHEAAFTGSGWIVT